MANIELLQTGCTREQIIDTINAIIAVINSGYGLEISYNDLQDKPIVNGVELKGEQTTSDLKIKFSEAADFSTWENALATKSYADAIGDDAVDAAEEAVSVALDGKLNKNLSNIDASDVIADDSFIPVVIGGKTVKVKASVLATYSGIKNKVESSSLEVAIKNQRTSLTISGTQNGTNRVFSISPAYRLGTSAVYLNGNRLYAGTDYIEDNSTQITFTNAWTPSSTDIILFEAIPLPVDAIPYNPTQDQ